MKKMKHIERGFTLSEVIITLVVLGIVAAITVPMMSNSVHDKKWNVARQKAKATIGEAFRLMTVNGEITTTNADGTPRTTEYMVTKVLPKYLKLEKTCVPDKYGDCGFPATVKTPNGTTVNLAPNNYKWTELSPAMVWKQYPTNKSYTKGQNAELYTASTQRAEYNTNYFFRTLDGFSVAFLYNPYCVSNTKEHYVAENSNGFFRHQILDLICLMGIYDMNGKKEPNKVGYDIGFIGSFYNGFETNIASVLPHSNEIKHNSLNNGQSNRWAKLYKYCDDLGGNHDWIMPDINELSLIHLNYKLVNNNKNNAYFEITRTPNSKNNCMLYIESAYNDVISCITKTDTGATNGPYVRCVRKTQLK